MVTCNRVWRTVVLAGLLVGLGARPSTAQPVAGFEAPASQAKGPLIVEQVKSGFVIAPDFKVTDLDGSTETLVGGYAGALVDGMFLIGGGGYWLTGGSDVDMVYGGVVVGWLVSSDRPIGFGTRALVGAGNATLKTDVTYRVPDFPGRPGPAIRFGTPGGGGMSSVVRRVEFDQGFFVFEPQADVVVKFADWVRLTCGVGYRVIGGANGLEDRLQGVTGSVALQFGGGR